MPTPLDPSSTEFLPWIVVLAATGIAAITDGLTSRIPNVLTLPLWVAGLVYGALSAGLWGGAESLVASLLLALPYILLFVYAGGGGGDAKIMGALGAWLGLSDGLVALLSVCGAGVVLALCWAAFGGTLRLTLSRLRNFTYTLFAGGLSRGALSLAASHLPAADEPDSLKMPYGIAIFLGVVGAAAVRSL